MSCVSNDVNVHEKKAIELIHEQHVDKLSVGDKEALKLLNWQSLVNLSITKKSFERLRELVSYRKLTVEKHIDLRLFTNIRKCLSSAFKEDFFVKKAADLAQRFYETGLKSLSDKKYGVAFCMTPELLYYAMFLAKDETVLEIAGAYGENAALLAFSGAKRVYMNEISAPEVESFKNLCTTLPPQVQEKIEPVLGNSFELLKIRPELKGTIGLLVCNNFVHILPEEDQENFLILLKTILKPGGRAIFTANACYYYPHDKEKFEQYPENTSWENTHCFMHNYLHGTRPTGILYQSSSPTKNVSLEYKQYYLWLSNKTTNYKWVEDKSGYEALAPEVADKLKQVVEGKLESVKKMYSGSLRLLINTFHVFREESFANYFRKAGFEVEQTFLIQENGHLFFGEDPYGKVHKIGIIIKAPIGEGNAGSGKY